MPMFERLALSRLAGALANHAAARQAMVAENVANADTPGYRARDLRPFAELVERGDMPMAVTRAGHQPDGLSSLRSPVDKGGEPAPNGNTVSLEGEMVTAAEIRHSHDLALAVYRSAGGIIRASLGKAG